MVKKVVGNAAVNYFKRFFEMLATPTHPTPTTTTYLTTPTLHLPPNRRFRHGINKGVEVLPHGGKMR